MRVFDGHYLKGCLGSSLPPNNDSSLARFVAADKDMAAETRIIKLLRNKLIKDLVYNRAEEYLTTENLDFILAYDDFAQDPSKEKLQTIISKFIPHSSSPFDASTPINIRAKVKTRCQQALVNYEDEEASNALAEAANELAATLIIDASTLLRFQKSTQDFPDLKKEILKLKKNETLAVASDLKPPKV